MKSEAKSLWKVWLAGFIYTCMVSIFVQFILLPFILPRYHAGDGMFIGVPDGVGFHVVAVDIAAKIRTLGWGVWQLAPGKQAPIGIASFIYALTWSKPWVLIPLNAAIHASAFLILFRFLNLFIQNKARSFLCALPFLVYPSSLLWAAQLEKDGFSILGAMLILQGLVSLSRLGDQRVREWVFINLRLMLTFVCGFILIRFVRPTLVMIMLPVLYLFYSGLFIDFLITVFKKNINWQKAGTVFLSFVLAFSLFSHRGVDYGLKDMDPVIPGSSEATSRESISQQDVQPLINLAGKERVGALVQPGQIAISGEQLNTERSPDAQQSITVLAGIKKSGLKRPEANIKNGRIIDNSEMEYRWRRLSWLPLSVENKFYALAIVRRGFRLTSPEAGSNIDMQVGFNSIKSIIFYLPRAVQIAFLAPFPSHWVSQGSATVSPLMRKISALETVVTYFGLIFMFFAVWHWRKRSEVWVISVFCASVLIIYGLVVCNIGTLYRLRYAYIMILAALGFAGFFVFLDKLKGKRARVNADS